MPDQLPRHDLPLLDGLRAVAALMVLTTHVGFQTGTTTSGPFGAVLARLDLGVALFFALSGFLLVRPWLGAGPGAGPSARRYLARRAVRILPAYWLVLGVALLTTASGAAAHEAVANVLLVQVYPPWLLPGLTQTWSLCTEVAFYLVLPLVAPGVAALARSRRGRGWLVVLLVATCAGAWLWAGLTAAGLLPAQAGTWLPGHLDWFAVGMALAVVQTVGSREPSGHSARAAQAAAGAGGSLVVLALALFWLVCTPVAGPRTLDVTTVGAAVTKELCYALLAGLALAAVGAAPQRSGAFATALGSRPAQLLGQVSYGVFLWHLLVLTAVMDVLGRGLFSGGFWPVLALTVIGSVLVAWVSWTLLESPLLRRVHRRPLRAAPRAGVVDPVRSR